MGRHQKKDLKVYFSRHYNSSFVLKPCARQMCVCLHVCLCVLYMGTLYGK